MSNDEYFVEIDGRKVPTSKQLRKIMGLMIGNTILTKKTKVTDEDYKLTPEQVRAIVWNLKKYSSVTFLDRLIEILKIIENGYEKAITVLPAVGDVDIENLKYLNESIHNFETGKQLILSGKKEAGYHLFRYPNNRIWSFKENFTGRKADELSWEWLGLKWEGGQKKHRGLYLWIDKAIDMAFSLTLGGIWTWPSNLTDEWMRFPVPQSFNYTPDTRKIVYRTGETIPFTGIWNPCDFKSGCPSFLLAGDVFPNTEIAYEKLERPDFYDEDDKKLYHGWLDFEYQEHPSRWELLWEDTRYLDGKIPEEEKEYLDDSCSFPLEPPEPPKQIIT